MTSEYNVCMNVLFKAASSMIVCIHNISPNLTLTMRNQFFAYTLHDIILVDKENVYERERVSTEYFFHWDNYHHHHRQRRLRSFVGWLAFMNAAEPQHSVTLFLRLVLSVVVRRWTPRRDSWIHSSFISVLCDICREEKKRRKFSIKTDKTI